MTGRPFRDTGDDVVQADMGPKVARLIAGWRLLYRGPCRHPDAEQWSTARDLRSVCLSCARASAALAQWEAAGPCGLCGRLLETPPGRLWTVPSRATRDVQLLVRLCDECSDEELSEPESPAKEQER